MSLGAFSGFLFQFIGIAMVVATWYDKLPKDKTIEALILVGLGQIMLKLEEHHG